MDRHHDRWRWFDRAAICFAGLLLALYGLTGVAGILAPEAPDAIHDGMPGLMWFFIIGSLYGAAAVVLPELNVTRAWQPTASQWLTATWVGGWSAMAVWGICRTLVTSGLAEARDFSAGAALIWFVFVGLPTLIWFGVRVRRSREADRYEGFIRD